MERQTPCRGPGDRDLSDRGHFDEGRDGDCRSPTPTAARPREMVCRYCRSSIGTSGYLIILQSLTGWHESEEFICSLHEERHVSLIHFIHHKLTISSSNAVHHGLVPRPLAFPIFDVSRCRCRCLVIAQPLFKIVGISNFYSIGHELRDELNYVEVPKP